MTMMKLGSDSGGPAKMDVSEPGCRLNVMVWNIESFTRGMRPNRRGLEAGRIRILANTLAVADIDVAVLLETGADAGDIRIDGYRTEVTAITGKPTSAEYDGETYAILFKDALAPFMSRPVLVGALDPDYRQAVYFTVADESKKHQLAICAIHAPSPGHRLDIRLDVLGRCCDAARRGAARWPLVFCGDLNIKSDEAVPLADLLGRRLGMTHKGPGEETSIRMNTSSLTRDWKSQPYDQVWYCSPPPPHAGVISARTIDAVIDAGMTCVNLAKSYMMRFENATLEPAKITRDRGDGPDRAGEEYLEGCWTTARAIHDDLTRLNGSADLLGIDGWRAFTRDYAIKVEAARGQRPATPAEYRCMIAYADELLKQAQLLLLLVQHAGRQTDVARAVATRDLMSDHVPVVFRYTFPEA